MMHELLKAGMVAGCVLALSGALAPTMANKLDDAKALDQKAANLVAAEGAKAFPQISDPKGGFVQGELYVVVLDQKGVVRAHPNPGIVGVNMWDSTDPDGVKFTQDAIKIADTTGSGWQTYKFTNPVDRKIETKRTWVQKAGDFVVMCGAYSKQ